MNLSKNITFFAIKKFNLLCDTYLFERNINKHVRQFHNTVTNTKYKILSNHKQNNNGNNFEFAIKWKILIIVTLQWRDSSPWSVRNFK